MARFRPLPLAVLLIALAVPARAQATDSLAPPGALPNWIPDEPWVYQHWLPYDEQRLYRLLGADRGQIWRHLRNDTSHNLAELGRRRGYTPEHLAALLVAPRAGHVPGARMALLRARALRTLTQGHLSQHIVFHSLHQTALIDRARWIFGVRPRDFVALRRGDISPLEIAHLYGHDAVLVRRRAAATLRSMARRGVRGGDVSPRQAATLVRRQLRQLPRWLGQRRNNGPPPLAAPGVPELPAADFANHPSISADGTRVAWDAYRAKIPEARSAGEIRVMVADVENGTTREASDIGRSGAQLPRSAYNGVLSADGRAVAFESSAGNLNFGKRYGAMRVVVRPLGATAGRSAPRAAGSLGVGAASAYNPSVSGDGRLVAFESSQQTQSGRTLPVALNVFDGVSGATRTIATGSLGATYEPKLSADGRLVVFTDATAESGDSAQIFARSLVDGTTVLVSRASGADGAASNGDAFQAAVSGDGTVVAFAAIATNLGVPGRRSRIYVRDLGATTTTVVRAGAGGHAFDPAVSADGRFVAFAQRPVDADGRGSARRATVWRYDRATGQAIVISRVNGPDGPVADGLSSQPAISADGRFVAFTSDAGNLSPRKPRAVPGVFLRDTVSGRTRLLSSHAPRVPSDGATVGAARVAAVCILGH